MYAGSTARLAFMGHTHRPVVRDTTRRRLVNVGSVGLPLDADPRAAYVVATPSATVPHGWEQHLRRVSYEVEAAIAAFDNGLQDLDPGYVELMSRQLRTGRDYFGPWMRLSRDLAADEVEPAMERYLEDHP